MTEQFKEFVKIEAGEGGWFATFDITEGGSFDLTYAEADGGIFATDDAVASHLIANAYECDVTIHHLPEDQQMKHNHMKELPL